MRFRIPATWQPDRERSAFSYSRRIRAHRSAMQIDKLLDHGQTDTHARLRTTGTGICLAKDLEDVWQERRIDSLPVVRHCQHNLVICFFEPDRNAPALGCEPN